MNKKAIISLAQWWVELVAFLVLVIGFIFSIFIKSAFVSYIIILLFGLMGGRIVYYKRHGFPFYMITIGFLIGYVLGTRYGDWKLTILLFFLGTAISYFIHAKGWLENI